LEAVQERLKNLRAKMEKLKRKMLDKIEKHFDVSISAECAEKVLTVEELAHLLHAMLTQKRPLLTYEEIFADLQKMLSKWFLIPIERNILPKTTFVEGLLHMMPVPPAGWKDDEENAS
jgi:acyl carrier protein